MFAEAAYDLNFAPAAAAKDGRTRTRTQALEMVLKPNLAHPALAAAPLSSLPLLLSLRPLTRLIYLPSLPSFQPLDILRSLNHQIELQLKAAPNGS